jgi:uncharacterized protein (DUF885 family)
MSRRRRFLRGLGRAGLLLVVALAAFLVPTIWLRPWSVEHFYTRVFVAFAIRHPSIMTSLGMLDGTPLDFYNDDLEEYSPEAQRRELEFAQAQHRMLRTWNRARMSPASRLSYDVMDWFLADMVEGERRFPHHDYPINQMHGFQVELPDFLVNLHPMRRPADLRNYVKRLSKFGRAVDQMIASLELRRTRGIVPPRWSLEKSPAQMRAFRAHAPRENPLFATLAPKLDGMQGLEPADRERGLADVERQVRETVYPAWDRLIAATERQLAVATDDDGVWKLQEGDAYYDYVLRHHTSTDLPADTVHAIGLAEVARIQSQMRAILAREGYPTADLAATVRRVQKEPRFTYPADDSGRARILADYRAILDDAKRRTEALFGRMPRGPLAVERVPPFREAGSAGAYYQRGSMDGKRPGTFYANLRDPAETARPGMRTLAYHEGIPGHHYQLAIQQELEGVPFFRTMVPFTAYAEGWALYAERVALEQGFHPNAYDSLGALQAELFRAVRLVVDTGIHRQRWDRMRAIGYMVANTGMDSSEVATEIERYIVTPGQACAYKVGQLQILRLRQHARDALGGRFDLKRFHDVVLTNGALPLALLERVVHDWIAAERDGDAARRSG